MIRNRFIFGVILIMTSVTVYNSSELESKADVNGTSDDSEVIFKDTINDFVFDSVNNNLGKILITEENCRLKRYFKYIGKDSIKIVRPWTTDPHFIWEWPKDYLKKDSIYSYTILLAKSSNSIEFRKAMGFIFSTGERIDIKLNGYYLMKVNSPQGGE